MGRDEGKGEIIQRQVARGRSCLTSPVEGQVSPGRLAAVRDTELRSVLTDVCGVTCSLDMEMGKIASGEQNTPEH